ncbi:MAG: hypothetical protein ACD_75C01900G0001 [uncultured bacterium]|nr:MAG: hypothetical protein ACD_75C01900G0001 [uncultured bacterium]
MMTATTVIDWTKLARWLTEVERNRDRALQVEIWATASSHELCTLLSAPSIFRVSRPFKPSTRTAFFLAEA